MDKLEEILRRVEAKDLHADDYETIRTVIESYVGLFYRGGRQEHHHPSAAEDAFRREDREDRGGDRQQRRIPPGRCSRRRSDVPAELRQLHRPRQDDGERSANAGQRPRPQWGRCLHRRREDRGASRVASAGRSLPEVRRRHGLRDEPPRGAGAAGGPGARGGQGLLSAEAALQSLRRGLHGQTPEGVGDEEVRRDGRQHDCAAEVRQRDAFQPRGEAAREPGHSLAGLDAVGHRRGPGRACRAGLRGTDPASGRKATWFTTTIPGSRFWR